MPPIAYSVTATLPDTGTASEYIAWLQGGHTAEVLARGASAAQVIRIDDPPTPIRVEARYTFPSTEAYRTYIEQHSPALRVQGLQRFGHLPGVSFERRAGAIL